MPRHSAAALILLLDALRRAGEDVEPVVRRFGLDAGRIDPGALIDGDLERRIDAAIAGVLRRPSAGLDVGSKLGIGSYGPFTLLLLTAADPLAAMRAAEEFQSLSFLSGRLAFEPGRVRSALELVPAPLPSPAFRFRVDLDVAGTVKLMQDLHRTAQVAARPVRIRMPYPRPLEAGDYSARLGCEVAWGGHRTRIELENARLRDPFATADPAAHAILQAQCRRLLIDSDRRPAGVSASVEAHLAASTGPYPSLQEAAAATGRSERTLRRQLQAEGTSFRRVLETVRRAKALELLRDPRLPVEAIAQQLGYGEAAAFIHAFRRWTGTTPSAWRRSGSGGPVA